MDFAKIPLPLRVAGLLLAGFAVIIGVDFMTASLPMTREFKDKNPFGVTGSNVSDYPGIIGTDPPLFVFDSLQDGINAAFNLLLNKYFAEGYTTVDQIGTRWSGDTTGGYAASLASITGFSPGVQLSYWFNSVQLMDGISKMENGGATQIPFTQLAIGMLQGAQLG